MKADKRKEDRVTLYIEGVPLSLKQQLQDIAGEHNRSLTGEVITALQVYVARHKLANADVQGKAEEEKRGRK
jgi:hypothetical protein